MADTQLTVAATSSRESFRDASALYARVFGYSSPDHSLNPKLLSAIVANGGTAVAASTGAGQLVGFAYGFVGFDGQSPYLYSQATFIDPDFQGHGVGRLLKQEQARLATDSGLTAMRWAFDPILSRNAHFNLDVLGARGVRFAPRYYDEAFSDRLIVEWDLTAAATGPAATRPAATRPAATRPAATVPAVAVTPRAGASRGDTHAPVAPADWGRAIVNGEVIRVPIPAANPETTLDPVVVEALRFAVADTFTDLFARGYVARSCVKVDDASATYLFVPATTLTGAQS
jgi:predicted GNAT superfamily acetyltransferase